MNEWVDFRLCIQPMAHAPVLGSAIAFHEAIGGRLMFCSRDGDWALLQFRERCLSLWAHPTDTEGSGPVALQLTGG
ncbi:MAG: hypothetical protein POG24_10175 [Acidocella sp.]|nr:hypothetical protein [Acidocella sp.]